MPSAALSRLHAHIVVGGLCAQVSAGEHDCMLDLATSCEASLCFGRHRTGARSVLESEASKSTFAKLEVVFSALRVLIAIPLRASFAPKLSVSRVCGLVRRDQAEAEIAQLREAFYLMSEDFARAHTLSSEPRCDLGSAMLSSPDWPRTRLCRTVVTSDVHGTSPPGLWEVHLTRLGGGADACAAPLVVHFMAHARECGMSAVLGASGPGHRVLVCAR